MKNHSNTIINQRIHLGNGRYFQRGICKDLSEGDTIEREMRTLYVVNLILVRDAKANNWTPEECKDAFYEAIVEEREINGAYLPLPNYTNTKADTAEILDKYGDK